MTKAIGDYVATRTDAPADVIMATDTVTTYTTYPALYTAMPEELKDYQESVADDLNKILTSVVSEDVGYAARPTGIAMYGGAGLAVAAAGIAALI